MRDGTAERLCRALADLVAALCRNNLEAVEATTLHLQRLMETEGEQIRHALDPETLREVRNLMEAAQCLIWIRLLSAVEVGAHHADALLRERV